MYNERQNRKHDPVFSKKLKAGKRRTYFLDVRSTRANDYYLTITESKKRYEDDGYERHKIFLYKEDFNKFISALTDIIDHIKTELMPEYDFDEFNNEDGADDLYDDDDFAEERTNRYNKQENDAPDTPPARSESDEDMKW